MLPSAYLSLVLAAAMTAAAAEPATRPVKIEFEAPDGCSGADAFFGSLRSRTDRVRRADGNEPRTTLQVRLTRAHGQVVGELRMMDDRGGTDTRKVQGSSCDEVVQALSLTAALALDPSARLLTPAAAPATSAAPATASAAAGAASRTAVGAAPAAPAPAAAADGSSTATAVPSVARAERPQAELPERAPEPEEAVPAAPSPRASLPVPAVEFAAGVVGLVVLSGDLGKGATLAARKTLGSEGAFRPTLGLTAVYVRNDLLGSPRVAQASLAALAGTVCPLRWTASILTFEPCALFVGGWLSVSGREVTRANTADRSWLSAGGTVRIAAFLGGGVSLELEGGVTAPLRKRRFFVTVPSNVVTETPAISPIVGMGLTYGL